jgi:shikimate kinase
MAVLGQGQGHGGFSLLHALGIGYGSSIGLNLKCRIRLLDKAPKRGPEDKSGVLEATLEAWKAAGNELPAKNLYWAVRSDIPASQGLKSSAALSVAAIRALMDATDVELSAADIVDIAARAQLESGVSLTGSVDDAWAAVEAGWKLVDPNRPAAQGVLLEGELESADEYTVLIVLRGEREKNPDPELFAMAGPQFQQALKSLEHGDPLSAMLLNGRAVATALRDPLGRKIANNMASWGATTAGMSGSGPAIVALFSSAAVPIIDRIRSTFEQQGLDVIQTSLLLHLEE